MRPIVRGECPKKDGKDIVYSDYANARGELIERIGEQCSYCEQHLDSSLAIEHKQPKKPAGVTLVNTKQRELDWHNFLLACVNCNSTKGDLDVVLEDYFWPDRDNTFRAFKYSQGGIVSPAEGLSPIDFERAKRTIGLLGLDKQPLNDPAAKDRRWQNRGEAWDIATRSKHNLMRANSPEMKEQIILTAHSYWSVWMTVFSDDPDMKQRFIAAFKGTATDCFDENFNPCPRPNGQI